MPASLVGTRDAQRLGTPAKVWRNDPSLSISADSGGWSHQPHPLQDQSGYSPRTLAPWGRPQGRRVSIPVFGNGRKTNRGPGVTAGFRFPRRHSRFPDECSCSGNAAEGLPFLLPRRCRGRRGRLVGCGPEALEGAPKSQLAVDQPWAAGCRNRQKEKPHVQRKRRSCSRTGRRNHDRVRPHTRWDFLVAQMVRLNALTEKGKFDSKIIECCNMAMDSSAENNMYINKVWVQCENESCLKWRRLSNEDKAKVNHSEPWYCFMNTDSKYNKCSVSEEDFPEESQLYQSGYKIVYSQLPLGSLVLVKLQNWPSWPGILCPDPFKGKYVTYDLDGDVEQYHVEFLGDPHSRSWIDAAFVGHYSITLKGCFLLGSKAELTCLLDLSSLNRHGAGKSMQAEKILSDLEDDKGPPLPWGMEYLTKEERKPEKCKKNKWYKSALQEAYLLYGCSHEQRLERCYLSKQDKSKAAGKVTVVAKKRVRISKNNAEKKNPKFRKRKRKAVLKSSFENVCSDDALSKENMVVSETEFLLKELEQMLEQALEHTTTHKESEEECGEEVKTREKLPKCGPEVPAGSSLENHCEEECLIIDGRRLKAGECIENITKKFKEIDALMSEF
ncbi:hypothetical protein MG293_017352 [Ovis ammon polii]|uniref:Zinc finger CW-type PWWP domain protein 2 n=1 Tax=Ovis ammon polii TaxID=230172 RepID=A0AAD4TT05_OVIAM|nr:hypothetical protein MG293_017352 [Ovis ammon polii]